MAATIIIPTRGRPDYLEQTLASVVPQAAEAGAELLVVDDGTDPASARVAASHAVSVISTGGGRGANAARNAGIEATSGDPVVFIDDDIQAPAGWLRALLDGATAAPEVDVFGGPITAVIEGGPRSCGGEGAPITTLDHGPEDRDVDLVWSANMAIRRRALERVGPFDETIHGRGEEEDWERRHAALGGRVRYLAGAGIEHRRTGADARLRALARSGYALGRTARRYDMRKGTAPTLRAELRVLAGCGVHAVRRRCPNMLAIGAHAAGRVREALAEPGAVADVGADDFLSGESGEVSGIRATVRAVAGDALCDAIALVRAEPWRLRVAARSLPRRRVLVLAIERTDVPNLLAETRRELERSRHEVTVVSKGVDGAGKFENLNALLHEHPAEGHDWLLVIDDDVALPRDFLDIFLFLAERFDLALAQPAHRRRSHAAWRVTRRRPGCVAHETRFVEIGPVTAFSARTFQALLPFPELRFGWGLELHWSALARARGWREGVIDAVPIAHALRRVASAYAFTDARAEARRFLSDREYTPASAAQQVVAEHHEWRPRDPNGL
jgi:GT2 family glycosyltransferase